MPVFQHPSLKSAKSFRLLLLRPSFSSTAPLECQLAAYDLSSRPRYEALSYTWESQTPCRPIRCNGSELLVTQNVEASLKQLRRYFFRRYLWIDAICIDQHNIPEQSNQVSLMDQIYHDARRVVVWLGTGDKSTGRAIRTLKWIFPVFSVAFYFLFTRRSALKTFRKMQVDFLNLLLRREATSFTCQTGDEGARSKLGGLRQIVHHDWFRRIWTIQEIALSRKAIVQCGRSKVGWASLSTVLTFDGISSRPRIPLPVLVEGGYNPALPIYDKAPYMIRLQQIQLLQERHRLSNDPAFFQDQRPPSQNDISNSFTPGQSLPFIFNFVLTGLNPEYRTSDPRDRIFGLIGVLHSLGVELATPDYEMSLENLVFEVFATITKNEKSLTLLNFVTGENSRTGLPTWVPDFSLVPWCPSNSGTKWESLDYDFTINGRRLVLSGIHVDTVTDTTETICGPHPQNQGRLQDAIELSSDHLVAQLQDWLHFVQSSTYSQEISLEERRRHLFKLLLHSQTLPFYEEAGSLNPNQRFLPIRLFNHFSRWIDHVESNDGYLVFGDDHVFDQVQNFIARELNIAGIEAASSNDRDLGYAQALLVIQRWVREYTARKRLFVTRRGQVGIGWRALKKGDLIVLVAGLRSPMIMRREEKEGPNELYQLIGPCDIPTTDKDEIWDGDLRQMTKFELT
jgi:hypothetical protein